MEKQLLPKHLSAHPDAPQGNRAGTKKAQNSRGIRTVFLTLLLTILCGFGSNVFAAPSVNWFMKTSANGGTTDISVMNNWTQDATGATSVGTLSTFAPTSGTTVFHIHNIANPTLGSNLTIGGGAGTVTIIVGDSADAVNFTVPSGFTLTNTSAVLSVANNATLTINNTSAPTLGAINSGSTVIYSASGSQSVAASSYGNLTVSGPAVKTITAASLTVNGVLTINSGAILNTNNVGVSLYSNFVNSGTLTAGSSDFSLSGTGVSVGSISTTGDVFINGNVTLTGNLTAGLLGISISGGVLSLGSGLTHTIGTFSFYGIMYGGSSTFIETGNLSYQGGLFIPQTSTVEYNKSGSSQLIGVLNYYNLVITGGGSKYADNSWGSTPSQMSVHNTLTVQSPTDTFNLQNYPLVDSGSFSVTNNGEIITQVATTVSATPIPAGKNWGSGVVAYGSIYGETIVAGTYSVITTNGATTLGGNVSTDWLTLNGIMTTGAYTMNMLSSENITNAGTSHYVYGNLSKAILGTSTVIYEIGDATEYLPSQLILSSNGTGGALGMSATAGSEAYEGSSYISSTQNVNVYFTITNNSAAGPATVTPKITYNSDDIIGGSNSSFAMQEYTGGTWTPTIPTPCTNSSTGSYSSYPNIGIALASVVGDYVFGVSTAPCMGTPTPGTTTLSPGDGETGTVFAASLSGATIAGGMTYQWQSSSTGGVGTFSNISGATNGTYNFTGISANTWYQCIVGCPAYSVSATSTSDEALYFTPATCTPSSSNATAACGVQATVVSLSLTGASGSITDNTSCNGTGYIDNLSMICTLNPGTNYTATVGTGTFTPVSMQVWIDFNGNGTFESSEIVGGSASMEGTGNNVTLTIPSTAPTGTFRMREVVDATLESHIYPNIDPCTPGYMYSEGRDYRVTIMPVGPVWNNVAGTSVCVGNNVTLTDATSGGIWSSTNTSVATIGTGGFVNGVSEGTSTISYAYSGGGGDIQVLTVNGAPAISAVSPMVGNAGSAVTITGTGFNSAGANDVVFFGATQATVTSASATSLSVNVPTGATDAAVTINNLGCNFTGYSDLAFLPDYNNSAYAPGTVNFDPGVSFYNGDYPLGMAIGDVNGDGKPDIVVANSGGGTYTISVYINTSTSGSITSGSFAPQQTFTVGQAPQDVAIGDVDGDGKPDIAISNYGGGSISILRNTTASGTLSFASPVVITGLYSPEGISMGDLDGDGRPDLAVAELYGGDIAVYRNTSSPGSISFGTKTSLTVGTNTYPYKPIIADMDGDGKPEIITDDQTDGLACVFRNTSTAGVINSSSFAAEVTYYTGVDPSIIVGDIDGDGKPDIISANGDNTVSILRNTASSSGFTTGSFGSAVGFPCGNGPEWLALGDADGDGKPDIFVINNTAGSISLFRNTAVSGSITSSSLAARVDFPAIASDAWIAVGDLDGDGKADIGVTDNQSATISVYRNDPLQAITGGATAICAGGGTTTLSDATPNGTWSSGATAVATVGSTTGVVSGVAAGTAVITYAGTAGALFTGNIVTMVVTVNVVPTSTNASNNGPVCAGTGVTLYDNSTNATGWLWQGSDGSSSTMQSPTMTPMATTTYSLTMTNSNGCNGVTVYTTVATVNALPTVSAGSGVAIAMGSSTTLNATSGFVTYEWSPSATLACSSCASSLASPTLTTTYTVTVTDVNTCSNNTTVTVTVNPYTADWFMKTSGNGGTTDISVLDNWTQDATGATSIGTLGTFAPANGITTFHIHNIANPILGSDLTIGGGGGTVNIIVGDSSDAVNFTVPVAYALSNSNANMSVAANATVTITNTTVPTFGMLDPASTVVYNASSSQTVTSATYGNLTVGNGSTVSYLAGGVITVNGTLETTNNGADLNMGSYQLLGALIGVNNNGTIETQATGAAPIPTGINWGSSRGFVKYDNTTTTQVVSAGSYDTLVVGGATGAVRYTVSGNITASRSLITALTTTTLNMLTYQLSGFVENIFNNGTFETQNTSSLPFAAEMAWSNDNGTILYDGAALQTIPDGSYVNLTLNNSAGLQLSGDIAVTGVLDFVHGIINVNSNIFDMNATVTGAGAGNYIEGMVMEDVPFGSNPVMTFPVGDALGYAPMQLSVTGSFIMGGIGVEVNSGLHPEVGTSGLSSSAMVNHYWTISADGVFGITSAIPQVTYNAGDIIGGNNSTFVTQQYNGSAWLGAPLATTNTTSPYTSAPNEGITSISGDYIFGGIVFSSVTGTSLCAGANTTLTDATGGGTWSSANTSVATIIGSSGVVTGVSAGTVTISYAYSGSGDTRVVTVNATPSSTGATNDGPVCSSGTVTLFDNSTNATGWSWMGSDGTSSTIESPTMTPTATTTYSLTVSNSDGCSNATVYTTTVSVNPVPSSTGAANSGPICSGGTVTLYDNSTNATGWSWHGSDGTTSASESPVMTPTATTTYSLTVSNSDECSNVAVYITTVVVNTTSAGTITGASSVNTGSNITLTDAVGGGSWSSSNTSFATVAGGVVTGVAAGMVTISYAVTGSCGTVYATKIITVNSGSVTGITGNGAMCGGTINTLSNSSPGGTWSMESLIATIDGSTGVLTASNAYFGTATVTYTLGSAHTTMVITVNPNPMPIQVTTSECVGTTTTLSDATAGGMWSGTGDATISGTGTSGTFIAGAVPGSVTITYSLPTSCSTTTTKTIYANPLPITGVFNLCVGGVTTLSDASPILNWFSGDTAVAKVLGSNVTGVRSGTATITFQSSATGYCLATQVVTVSAQPAGITGNSSALCPGSTLALSDGTGTWTSNNTAIATIGSTGVVTGVAGGTAVVTYLEAGTAGCTANAIVTVNTVAAIAGSTATCLGGTTVLSDATAGGTWLSGSTGVATVNAVGLVTGTGAGTAMITYTTAGGCEKSVIVTVSSISAGISGNLFLCNGTTTTLSDASAGGTWTMSSLIATIGSSTGVVTASASYAGTATISYISGGCSVLEVLTVNAPPAAIQGASGECAGVTTPLTDATGGGTWSISGDATISGSGASAVLTAGAVGGTATVSYSLGTGCVATSTNTIYANPQPITGNFNLCVGLVTDLTDASPVNSWSSSNTAIATVAGPDVTGHGVGVATITFKSSAAGYCTTMQTVTVNAMPVVTAINGPATISHAGSPVSISDATTGGIWTSSNTSVITLSGSTGSPINARALATTGSSVITYAVTIAGCTSKVTKTYSASASSHSDGGGTTTVYAGSEVIVADDISGGIWSSSDNGIATVDGNGSVTGIAPGNVIITHEIAGDDGAVSSSVTNVIVSAAPVIINVLPNPNRGTFMVRGTVGSVADEVVALEVTDLLGQVIYHNKTTAYGGKLNETITLSNTLANGMYILNVQSATETKSFHFVIEQ